MSIRFEKIIITVLLVMLHLLSIGQATEKTIVHDFGINVEIALKHPSPSTTSYNNDILAAPGTLSYPTSHQKYLLFEFSDHKETPKEVVKLFTTEYGDLFFEFSKIDSKEDRPYSYRLFYSKVKLNRLVNYLRLEYSDKGQIWITHFNELTHGSPGDKKKGEGVLWKSDADIFSIQQEGSFLKTDDISGVIKHISHRSSEENVTRILDDSPVYGHYYDDVISLNAPKDGGVYRIKNIGTNRYLGIYAGNTEVYVPNPASENLAPSFLWRVVYQNNSEATITNLGTSTQLRIDSKGDGGGLLPNVNSGSDVVDPSAIWTIQEKNSAEFLILSTNNRSGNGQALYGNAADQKVMHAGPDHENNIWVFLPTPRNNFSPSGGVKPMSTNDPFNIRGWSYDPDEQGSSLSNQVFVDNNPMPIAIVRGSNFDAEINAQNNITGSHGFCYKIDAAYYDGNTHTFTIKAMDATASGSTKEIGKVEFKYSPCSFSAASADPVKTFTKIASIGMGPGKTIVGVIDNAPKKWDGTDWVAVGTKQTNLPGVSSVAMDKNGTFWVTDKDLGIILYNDNSDKGWQRALADASASQIACSPNSMKMAFVTTKGSVYTFDPITRTNTLIYEGKGNSSVVNVAVGIDGRIWWTDKSNRINYRLGDSNVMLAAGASGKSIACGLDGSVFWVTTDGKVCKWDGKDNGFVVTNFGVRREQLAVWDANTVAALSVNRVYTQYCITITTDPAINSVSSFSGPVGSLLTINGTGLISAKILINNTEVLQLSNTGTKVVAMVMPGTTTGRIGTMNNNVISPSAIDFNVTESKFPNKQKQKLGEFTTALANAGRAVAINADGSKAVVAGIGKAWIFNLNKSNGNWEMERQLSTDKASKPTAAISADGNTAILGAISKAYLLKRESNGTWSSTDLSVAASKTIVGTSVSISADGNTALVGGHSDTDKGGAWIFRKSSAGLWSQFGDKLVGSESDAKACQGSAVCLSADGNTIIIGGFKNSASANGNTAQGAVWIFVKDILGRWRQQGAKLTGKEKTRDGRFMGSSVSLSADGNMAIVGGYYVEKSLGAVWIFKRDLKGTWTQEGDILAGTDLINSSLQYAGSSVSISADGNYAVVGATGNNNGLGGMNVYTRSNSGVWSKSASNLSGTPLSANARGGFSVAISSDGNTAIMGANADNQNKGSAFIFTKSASPKTNAAAVTRVDEFKTVEESEQAAMVNIPVTIYPNPASEEINVSFVPQDNAMISIGLYNTAGMLVTTKQIAGRKGQKVTCTFSGIKSKNILPGMYVVKINMKNKLITKKVIVE